MPLGPILQYRPFRLNVEGLVPAPDAVQYAGNYKLTTQGWVPDTSGSGVTALSVVSPFLSTGGSTPTLSIKQAGPTSSGYLSIADWQAFNAKEPGFGAGTAAQYLRGDKTWQALNKTAVGLPNVENTALSTWGGSSNLTVLGIVSSLQVNAGFGCNSKTPQTAYASGGALTAYVTGAFGLDSSANMTALYNLVVAMRAALVANGIMS